MMKHFFTLLLAACAATTLNAQMHGAMKFVGASNLAVSSMNIDNASDTIAFEMADMTSGNITLPAMKGMQTIPSFTIEGAKFSMGADHTVTFDNQTFTATVDVDGETKNITGSSLTGTYSMADNSFSLTAVFQYGRMPLPMTYTIKGYYLKSVTYGISVTVGGLYTYTNPSVTYKVRKYVEDNVEKVDVEVPTYTLDNTIMGNLTLGTYTVKGLTYDEELGGFYRDYKDDNLSFHFKSEGSYSMDGEYEFNSSKDNNILVKYTGSNIDSIVNTFQMGSMPFQIVSTFSSTATAIDRVSTDNGQKATDGRIYNLAGQRVGEDAKGIVIINGKKYLKK